MATRATNGVSRARGDDAVHSERIEEVNRLLDAWLADESGYDEETWPHIELQLNQETHYGQHRTTRLSKSGAETR